MIFEMGKTRFNVLKKLRDLFLCYYSVSILESPFLSSFLHAHEVLVLVALLSN